MVVVVFRSRIRESADLGEVGQMGERMYALAAAMPGFVACKDFAAADGENVSIVEFESHDTLLAWRNHPEHAEVQRRGREAVFSEYHIQVCDTVRDYAFAHAAPATATH
jgi:heme-degrading monooxygenase HmoA